jgi:hypothetical protein
MIAEMFAAIPLACPANIRNTRQNIPRRLSAKGG